MCTWRNSTLELDTFAPSILHPLAIIELPIHFLATYVIMFKTPATMGAVKRPMLVLQSCGAYCDLFLIAFATQYFLSPAAAGYTVGLYTYLGIPVKWQEYMSFSSVSLIGCSILGFFESRYHTLVYGSHSSYFKKRLLYIAGHCIYSCLFPLPVILMPPDQEIGKQHVKKLLHCVPDFVLDNPNFFVFAIDNTLLIVIMVITMLLFFTEIWYFIIQIILFLTGPTFKSKQTHKLQIRFFIALCIQVSIPLIVLIVPISYNVYVYLTGYYNQALNNITINFISFHGVLSSIVMLIIHKPYRQAVIEIFCDPFYNLKYLIPTDSVLPLPGAVSVLT